MVNVYQIFLILNVQIYKIFCNQLHIHTGRQSNTKYILTEVQIILFYAVLKYRDNNNRTLFTNVNITAFYLLIINYSYNDMRTSVGSNSGSGGLLGVLENNSGDLIFMMNFDKLETID